MSATNVDATTARRHRDAVEVFHCSFNKKWDHNFDNWPDNWHRKQGIGFPRYLDIGIVESEGCDDGRAIRVNLNGGAAMVASPPIQVDSRFSYVLECNLRCQGLHHDRAYVSVTFFDKNRKQLGKSLFSQKILESKNWTTLHLGPFSPGDTKIEMAVIGLHVQSDSERSDLKGWAEFDDMWFARMPRMNLRTNRDDNVYTDPSQVEVTCSLSGIVERDPEIRFELLDASNQAISKTKQRLAGELIAQKSSKASDLFGGGVDKPAGYAGSTTWKPPLAKDDYGFYRVRVTMRSPTDILHEREITLAVIRPLGNKNVRGEFGWSLPRGDRPLTLDSLLSLLPHVGVNWLKFPVWYGDHEKDRGDKLMRFAERIGSKGIEMVGILDSPPQEILDSLGDSEHQSAANVFSADSTVWQPSLDPVMTRLSLRIRWWQLGSDHDTSFVGYPNLAAKIREIKSKLYRFGQEVHLGIGWRWLAEQLPEESPPWDFLTLSANPPLTGKEMSTYLSKSNSDKAKRWALVEPLPRSEYNMETRLRDLVDQMMSAKIKEADGIFIPNPFSTEHGLMNDDGTPGELLLPWRTTALVLGGSKYLGSIRMPSGSSNHIYTRDGEAVMVIWNTKKTEEVIYLGEDVRQIDIWGRMATPRMQKHRQVIKVGPLPTFITGINEQITRWRMTVKFDQQRMPSVFGTSHRNGVYMKNFFSQGAGGKIQLVTPKVWKTFPRNMNFKLAVGEQMSKNFEVTLPFTASSGQHDIRIDFDVNVDRRYQFSVYRELDVGLGDVTIDVQVKLENNGVLIVKQRMTNNLEDIVDFKCLLHAPGRRRQSNQVFRLGRGTDLKIYRFPRGQDLVGKELWLRAEEINGQRILNYRFKVELE